MFKSFVYLKQANIDIIVKVVNVSLLQESTEAAVQEKFSTFSLLEVCELSDYQEI